MTKPNARGPWLGCPCGIQHPRGCHGHVDECTNTDCLWRGGNVVGNPCHKCAAPVRLRPCRQAPWGTGTVCGAHGARSPQVAAADAERQERDRVAGAVADLLERFDQPDVHPLEGILAVVRLTGRTMRALEHLVGELDVHPTIEVAVVGDGANLGGMTGLRWETRNKALYGTNHLGDGAPNILVEMLRTWTADHLKACKVALDAGIDERRLRLEEGETDQLFEAVTAALKAAELNVAQQEAFTLALAGELRALEA